MNGLQITTNEMTKNSFYKYKYFITNYINALTFYRLTRYDMFSKQVNYLPDFCAFVLLVCVFVQQYLSELYEIGKHIRNAFIMYIYMHVYYRVIGPVRITLDQKIPLL